MTTGRILHIMHISIDQHGHKIMNDQTSTLNPDFTDKSADEILRWVNEIRIKISNGIEVSNETILHAINAARTIRERRAMASRSPNAKAHVKADKPPPMNVDDL